MATTIQSTQLDFSTIKNKLRVFLAQQPEFADYNFEASGLNNILDVLAYNTHFNGLIANFALNESFLTTAQLRSSVVSLAESLGYTPRSKTASVAYLNLSIINTSPSRSSTVTLPSGTTFTAAVDGVSYTFQTLAQYVAVDNGIGVYTFNTPEGSPNIPVYEGRQTTKTFYVDQINDQQVFVIPDTTVDTLTLDVKVFDSPTSTSSTTYTSLKTAIRIDSNSTYYDIHETPNGHYEIHFSDGITTGRAPVPGNKVVVTYISTAGSVANGAASFSPNSTVTMDGNQYVLNVLTAAVSAGGSDKESIDSIRQNAPIAFTTQQRLVTAQDYRGVILSNYGSIADAIAWGGEDNVPPQYGKTFVSLKFQDNISAGAQQIIKDSIISNITSNLAIMSIDTEFVDPVVVYIGCQTFFNFNPNKSAFNLSVIESQVINTINDYFNVQLSKFGSVFRRSNLLATIDNLSPAILDSRIDVFLSRYVTIDTTRSASYSLTFPTQISVPSGTTPIVTSSNFVYNSKICSIQNVANSTKLSVVTSQGEVVVDNIGSYNAVNGTVNLIGFFPSSIVGGGDLRVSVVPANQSTVKALANYTFEIDPSLTFATGIIDYENSRTSI